MHSDYFIKALSLSPGQTIATSQRDISQHCWPRIWKLRPNDRNIVERNILPSFGHPIATCCELKIELVRTPKHKIVKIIIIMIMIMIIIMIIIIIMLFNQGAHITKSVIE